MRYRSGSVDSFDVGSSYGTGSYMSGPPSFMSDMFSSSTRSIRTARSHRSRRSGRSSRYSRGYTPSTVGGFDDGIRHRVDGWIDTIPSEADMDHSVSDAGRRQMHDMLRRREIDRHDNAFGQYSSGRYVRPAYAAADYPEEMGYFDVGGIRPRARDMSDFYYGTGPPGSILFEMPEFY